MKRVVVVICFLAKRGLAFRGTNELVGSPHNGNYLGILELVAKFDDFLATHLAKYANQGRGRASYLSSTICDELISKIALDVRSQIIGEIKEAKYFSIIVDSTPDVSHTDQLTVAFRYVNSDGQPVERFVEFVPFTSHKAQSLEDTVLEILNRMDLDLNNCRGQCYDNASNMSGKYNGLQTRIKNHNKYAAYIPCSAHSLNLVGTCAVACCPYAIRYFTFIQKIYTFASASPARWEVFKFTGTGSRKNIDSDLENQEVNNPGSDANITNDDTEEKHGRDNSQFSKKKKFAIFSTKISELYTLVGKI